jgi:glyoxylase I family protein
MIAGFGAYRRRSLGAHRAPLADLLGAVLGRPPAERLLGATLASRLRAPVLVLHGCFPPETNTAGCTFSRTAKHRDQAPALNRSPRLGNVPRMPIKLENVGIAVRDLEATIAFFTDLGLTVLGRDTVSGEWTDTAVGLDGNHANIAMLQTPDGNGRLELFEYIHPDAIETKPTRPNEIGMHRVAFSVDDIDEALETAARHGCHPLRGVATYGDVYKLTYVRGPSGILVMLAEELNKS